MVVPYSKEIMLVKTDFYCVRIVQFNGFSGDHYLLGSFLVSQWTEKWGQFTNQYSFSPD